MTKKNPKEKVTARLYDLLTLQTWLYRSLVRTITMYLYSEVIYRPDIKRELGIWEWIFEMLADNARFVIRGIS